MAQERRAAAAGAGVTDIDLTGAVYEDGQDIVRMPDGSWLPAASVAFYEKFLAKNDGVEVHPIPVAGTLVAVITGSRCRVCRELQDPRLFCVPDDMPEFPVGEGWSLPGSMCLYCAFLGPP